MNYEPLEIHAKDIQPDGRCTLVVTVKRKQRRLQCKDIPTRPILEFLAGLDRPANWCFRNEQDVRNAMPDGFNLPDNLVHAKMRNLIYKGLVDGCTCGCRGDFVVTEKGRSRIREIDFVVFHDEVRARCGAALLLPSRILPPNPEEG